MGTAYCHSAENLLSSHFVYKNIKNCNFSCSFVWVSHSKGVSEIRVVRRMFGCKEKICKEGLLKIV
jgi:hypothetical protein